MRIDVENLREKLSRFSHWLEKYQNNYMNYYNELNDCKNYWKDNFVSFFYDRVDLEKKENQRFYEELVTLKDVYKFLLDSYDGYGNNIEIELDDNILKKIDRYMSNLEKLIDKYNNLDSYFIGSDYYIMVRHKNILIENKNKILNLKEEYKNIFKKVEKIEKNVKLKIREMDILKIEENSSELYLKGLGEGFKIELNILSDIVKKLKFFIDEDDLYVESLIDLLNIFCYDTDNLNELKDIEFLIIKKLKIINKNHRNNLIVLNKVIEKYDESQRKIINIFEDGLNG